MYRYMLAYTSTEPLGTTNGNTEIRLPHPITTMDDVTEITHMLRERFRLTNPILLSFCRFEDDPASPEAQ